MPWGYSSVGRAPALQAGGQGFESLYLHCHSEENDNIIGHKHFAFTTKKEAPGGAQKEAPDGAQVINLRLMTVFIENYTLKQTSRIQNIQDIRGYSVRKLTE